MLAGISPVADVSVLPWCGIAQIEAKFNDGDPEYGTAFFIAANAMLTAAHTLREDGRTLTDLSVWPCSGRPFHVPIANVRFAPGWYDCAYLALPHEAVDPNRWCFNVRALANQDLQGSLTVAGFPTYRGTRENAALWWGTTHYCQLFGSEILAYKINLLGGHSGAPVWKRYGETRVVVGIHRSAPAGSSEYWRACRITPPLKAWIIEQRGQ